MRQSTTSRWRGRVDRHCRHPYGTSQATTVRMNFCGLVLVTRSSVRFITRRIPSTLLTRCSHTLRRALTSCFVTSCLHLSSSPATSTSWMTAPSWNGLVSYSLYSSQHAVRAYSTAYPCQVPCTILYMFLRQYCQSQQNTLQSH